MMEKLRINSMERWRPVGLGVAAMHEAQAAHHRNGDANPTLSHGTGRGDLPAGRSGQPEPAWSIRNGWTMPAKLRPTEKTYLPSGTVKATNWL
ncbi:MAG: hypothetical protein ACYCZD_05315 [Rhodanobacter sp.]